MLRPEHERIEGFVDNIRYRSLTREGWILSLSGWRDEKALVRWRTRAGHHEVQEKGRGEILLDYHLRVGQVTRDSRPPAGHVVREQRLDETETGAGTTVTLIDGRRPADRVEPARADGVARWLGLAPAASGLVGWDVFAAVLSPGDVILLMSWRDHVAAEAFEGALALPEGARLRRVRVVRDYGMFDRRGAAVLPGGAARGGGPVVRRAAVTALAIVVAAVALAPVAAEAQRRGAGGRPPGGPGARGFPHRRFGGVVVLAPPLFWYGSDWYGFDSGYPGPPDYVPIYGPPVVYAPSRGGSPS